MPYNLVNLFSTRMLKISQGISRFEDAKTDATQPGADCNSFFFFFFLPNAVSFFVLHSLFWFSLHSKARF